MLQAFIKSDDGQEFDGTCGINRLNFTLSARRYDIGRVLGAGSFGIVREAIGRRTGTRYACKTVRHDREQGGAPRRTYAMGAGMGSRRAQDWIHAAS